MTLSRFILWLLVFAGSIHLGYATDVVAPKAAWYVGLGTLFLFTAFIWTIDQIIAAIEKKQPGQSSPTSG